MPSGWTQWAMVCMGRMHSERAIYRITFFSLLLPPLFLCFFLFLNPFLFRSIFVVFAFLCFYVLPIYSPRFGLALTRLVSWLV